MNRTDIDEASEGQRDFLDALHGLLAEGAPYADLSVGRIAERAGRTRTGFYFYFRDKRDLLLKAAGSVAGELYDESDRWWSGQGGPDDLRLALTEVLRIYRADAPLLRAIVHAAALDEGVGSFWRGLVDQFIDATENRLVSDGRDPADARATAFSLVWMTERSCYQHVVDAEPDIADGRLVDSLVAIWQRSIYSPASHGAVPSR